MIDLGAFKGFTPEPVTAINYGGQFGWAIMYTGRFAIANVDNEHYAKLFAAAPDLLTLAREQRAELKMLRAEVAKQRKRATDAEYMGEAYFNMLGETGLKVANMWREKNITRVHFDWGPDAKKLTGEQRAQFILDIEESAKRSRAIDNIDGDLTTTAFDDQFRREDG